MYFSSYFYQYYFRFPNSIYSITINTADSILTLYEDGKAYKTYPVSVGKPTTPTQNRNWVITKKRLWREQFGGDFM